MTGQRPGTSLADSAGAVASETTPAQTAAPRNARVGRYLRLLTRGAVAVAFVGMVALFSALRPDTFATTGTLTDILDQSSIPIILVCGLTFILASGQFDLSFPGTLGLCSAVAAALLSFTSVPVAAVIVITLLTALGAGIGVGMIVALRPASTFIITLAAGSVLTGLELAVSGDKTIYNNIPESFSELANTKWLGLYRPVWLALLVVLVTAVLLHATRFGRHVSATGSNSTAAFLAGVRVKRVWAYCFVIVSVAAGIAAISYTSTISSYIPGSFASFLLSSYAAVFLGSTVAGGRFTIPGSVFGVIWLTTLQTGLIQLNEPAWTSSVVEGIVLAGAVLVSSRGWRARS